MAISRQNHLRNLRDQQQLFTMSEMGAAVVASAPPTPRTDSCRRQQLKRRPKIYNVVKRGAGKGPSRPRNRETDA